MELSNYNLILLRYVFDGENYIETLVKKKYNL
jgi:hypothetical protein